MARKNRLCLLFMQLLSSLTAKGSISELFSTIKASNIYKISPLVWPGAPEHAPGPQPFGSGASRPRAVPFFL
jgi:hypothetical protein